MINWAEIDPEFQAIAKGYQDRYDGKGHFLAPGVKEKLENPDCANVFSKFEVTVTTGAPVTAENGMPVRFEIKSEGKDRWAIGWIPSCTISKAEGLSESEQAFFEQYLKENASAIIYSDYVSRLSAAEGEQAPAEGE